MRLCTDGRVINILIFFYSFCLSRSDYNAYIYLPVRKSSASEYLNCVIFMSRFIQNWLTNSLRWNNFAVTAITFQKARVEMSKIINIIFSITYSSNTYMIYYLLLKVLLKLSFIRFILRSAGTNLSFWLVIEVVNVNNTEKRITINILELNKCWTVLVNIKLKRHIYLSLTVAV